jgi:hypothetical protein
MENRRPTSTSNTPRPLNRTNNFSRKKETDRLERDVFNRATTVFNPRKRQISKPRRPTARRRRCAVSKRQRRPNQRRDTRFQSDERIRAAMKNFNRETESFNREITFQPRGRFAPKGKGFKPWERDQPTAHRIGYASNRRKASRKISAKHDLGQSAPDRSPDSRSDVQNSFPPYSRRKISGFMRRLRNGRHRSDLARRVNRHFRRAFRQNVRLYQEKSGSLRHQRRTRRICEMEVVPFLKKMEKRRRVWDVVYFDPPYDSNYDEVLAYFSRGAALKPGGVLVIEHPRKCFSPKNSA